MLEYLWILQRTLHFRPLLVKLFELQISRHSSSSQTVHQTTC